MKKTHQRITRGLAAGLLVAALAAMPVSASTIGSNGIGAADNFVTIDKVIAIYNDGYNKSYNPNVTYTFEVSAATVDGVTVTDSNGTVIAVKNGVAAAIVGQSEGKATVTCPFTSAEIEDNTTSLAEGIKSSFNIAFNPAAFTDAGIYRFKIDDVTPAATLLAAGIVRPAGYEATKYLDVYVVKNTTPGEDGFVINGYVLIDTNTSLVPNDDHKDPGFRPVITETEIPVPGQKVDGYPDEENSSYGITGIDGDNTFDYYKTFNMEVDKSITGNMADTSHAFPFVIGLTNQAAAAVPTNVYVGTDKTNLSDSTAASYSPNLANNGKYYVYGINPLATVNVKETNNTTDTYTASITYNGTADGTATALAAGAEKAATPIAVSDYNSAAAAVPATITNNDGTVAYNNDLTAGTPTGIALMVAPFIAVAAVIATIFGINKIKTKKETDAE